MNNLHIVIDLETWGNTPGSALRSIGAVAFDPYTGTEWSVFYVNVADNDPVLTKDPHTVDWWAGQPEAAQAVFNDPKYLLLDPRDALCALAHWFVSLGVPADVQTWGHGASYDVPHLIAAFAAHDLSWPLHYRAPRDTRTLFEIAGWDVAKCLNDFAAPGAIYHFALDDAKCEARAISAAYKVLGITRQGETPATRFAAVRASRDGYANSLFLQKQELEKLKQQIDAPVEGWQIIEASDDMLTIVDSVTLREIVLNVATLEVTAIPDGSCKCVDCGGDQPEHAIDCKYVRETFGEHISEPPAVQVDEQRDIVVYCIPDDEFECKPCNEVKAMLDAAGLEYDVRPIRVELRPAWYLANNVTDRKMPQMFVDDVRIGGRDNVKRWLAAPRQ